MYGQPSLVNITTLLSKLKSLGYEINGVTTFPRIEGNSVIETEGDQKDDCNKVVTGVIDILSRDNAPDESFEILNIITSNISENISLSEYICYIWQNESVEMIEELTDSDDTIYRQYLRFRTNLIKK